MTRRPRISRSALIDKCVRDFRADYPTTFRAVAGGNKILVPDIHRHVILAFNWLKQYYEVRK